MAVVEVSITPYGTVSPRVSYYMAGKVHSVEEKL